MNDTLRRIKLPYINEPLSAICFGTAQFGDSISEERAYTLLDRFYEIGGNFIDTANVYPRWVGTGENSGEIYIGRWLKSRGVKDMVVATKGCHFAFGRPFTESRVRAEFAEIDVDDSLRSLGLDVIPLYYLHRDDESRPIEEIVEFCEDLKRRGKIMRYGFSNYKAYRVRGALDYADKMGYERIFGVSNEWSLAEEHGTPYDDPSKMVLNDDELYRLHTAEGLPLIPFTANAHGYFTRLDAGEVKRGAFGNYDTDENRALLPRLREIAAETGASVGEVAIAYLYSATFPVIPIVSTSKPEHLDAFLRIASVDVPSDGLRKFGIGEIN